MARIGVQLRRFTLVLLLLLSGAAPAAAGVAPLVDADWLAANLGTDGLVVLDVRNRIGGATAETFVAGHVPGAVYSDYLRGGWRRTVDGVPGQLPPTPELEALIGGLGIDKRSHVVIVAGGTSAADMASAARVYWTFKVLGHDRVSVLDGGWRAYVQEPSRPVETGPRTPMPKTFVARFRPELAASRDTVAAAMEAGTALLDIRPPPFYRGRLKARIVARAGTIPGARNLPEGALVDAGGRFVVGDRLAALAAAAGTPESGPVITFCNTGHWAALGWFALSEILGRRDVRVYDGSMADWAARPELPVAIPE